MAVKRKSSAFESDSSRLENGVNTTQWNKGADLLCSPPPAIATSAPASKRRKSATLRNLDFSNSSTAKRRGRPLGKKSILTSSTSGSRASLPATQTSAQAPPLRQPSSIVNRELSEELHPSHNIFARPALPAIDNTALNYATQGIGLESHLGFAASQSTGTASALQLWQAKDDNVTAPPIYTRDNHPHVDLVLGLTDEINMAEKRVAAAEASQKASHDINKKLTHENAVLKMNRVLLLDWLKENAPGVQLPAEIVKTDLTSTITPITSTSSHSLVESSHLLSTDPTTPPPIRFVQDQAHPPSSSTPPEPLLSTHTSDPGSFARHQLRAIRNLSPGELQLEHAQLKVLFQEAKSTIAALTNEIAVLKNREIQNALPDTQLEAEIHQLYKSIDKLKDTQATFADAVYEYARLERYLTAMCVKYKNFVQHLEENMNMHGVVAAAKHWVPVREAGNEAQFTDEGIASADIRGPPLDWQIEAARRDSGYATTSGDIDPSILSTDGGNNSFAIRDSGFIQSTITVSPPAVATPITTVGYQSDLSQYRSQDMMPPPAAPTPLGNLDGYVSPESLNNMLRNNAGVNIPLAPPNFIYEDDNAVGATPSMREFTSENTNSSPYLNTFSNANSYHGDGDDMLAGVGEGFYSYPNSALCTNINAYATRNQRTLDERLHVVPFFQTNNLPDMRGPPLDTVSPSACHQYNCDFQSLFNETGNSNTAMTSASSCNVLLPAMNDILNDSITNFNKENTPDAQTTEDTTFLPRSLDVDDFHWDDNLGLLSCPLP